MWIPPNFPYDNPRSDEKEDLTVREILMVIATVALSAWGLAGIIFGILKLCGRV